MNAKITLRMSWLGLLIVILAIGLSARQAQAQTMARDSLTTESMRMDRMAGTLGEAKITDRLSADFSSFLGADAGTVVTGLRNGTPIILTREPGNGAPGHPPASASTTITPPTAKMGFGNVFISLALAKQQLGQLGITQPTPQQLQAALVGGTITSGSGPLVTTTNLQGILTLRSQNMGWGRIAQEMGFKLGPVASGLKAANHGLVMGAVSPNEGGTFNAAGHPASSSESGVVAGGGRAAARSGKGLSGRSQADTGIVNGFGHPMGSEGGITTGRGHAYGVTGEVPAGAGQSRGRTR